MAKRYKMSGSGSRKLFSRTASRSHVKNMLSSSVKSGPMRGGIRL